MEDESGDTLRMRRFTRLDTAPVPLGPAMNNPVVQTLRAVDIDAKINWYATYVIVTKQVTAINQDPKRRNGVFKFPLIDLEAYVTQEAA